MKKKLRFTVAVLLIVTTMAVMTGCATYDNFKQAFLSEETQEETVPSIKIGVYEPASGEYKKMGEAEIRGIELAHEQVPSTSNGIAIDLVYADNGSNIEDARSAMTELMSASPTVILGSYGDTLSMVASDYIKAASVPAITVSSTNPMIPGHNEFYFAAGYSEVKQGDALADFVFNQCQKDTVATIRLSGDDVAIARTKRFANKFKKVSGNPDSVTANLIIYSETADYGKLIERLRESKAKAVFLDVPPKEAQNVIQQCIDNNLTHLLFLGSRSWNDDTFMGFAAQHQNIDIGYVTEQAAADITPEAQAFIDDYKLRYGTDEEPSMNTMLAYDAYMMTVKAIENAYSDVRDGDVEKAVKNASTDAEVKAIREAWSATLGTGIPSGMFIKDKLSAIKDYQGVSGTINFRGKNDAIHTIAIDSVIKGESMPTYVY